MANIFTSTSVKIDTELVQALADVYQQACTDKNYGLCDIVRMEILRYGYGKKFLIRLEPADKWLIDPLAALLP